MERRLSLWSYRPLFRNLVRRDVRHRYKGSALGIAWALINPLLVVASYWVVFTFLFGTPIPNYALFLFVGLMVWAFFFGGLAAASKSIVSNSSLVTKVRFPRAIIPASAVAANAVVGAAMLVIAVPLCLWQSPGSYAPLILLPLLVGLTLLLTLGLGLLLAALNVYFRDVSHIIDAVGVPWFFITPIFYTYATLPAAAQSHTEVIALLHWGNPISPFVIAIQDVLFFGSWPTIGDTVYCLLASVLALLIGWLAFRRMEPEMAVEL